MIVYQVWVRDNSGSMHCATDDAPLPLYKTRKEKRPFDMVVFLNKELAEKECKTWNDAYKESNDEEYMKARVVELKVIEE